MTINSTMNLDFLFYMLCNVTGEKMTEMKNRNSPKLDLSLYVKDIISKIFEINVCKVII